MNKKKNKEIKRKRKRRRERDDIEKELNVLTFSQNSSSDVLNFHNFSKNGIFQYAAFIMETSWWNYALVIVQRSLYTLKSATVGYFMYLLRYKL